MSLNKPEGTMEERFKVLHIGCCYGENCEGDYHHNKYITNFITTEIAREKARLLEAIVWPEIGGEYSPYALGVLATKTAVIKAFTK